MIAIGKLPGTRPIKFGSSPQAGEACIRRPTFGSVSVSLCRYARPSMEDPTHPDEVLETELGLAIDDIYRLLIRCISILDSLPDYSSSDMNTDTSDIGEIR